MKKIKRSANVMICLLALPCLFNYAAASVAVDFYAKQPAVIHSSVQRQFPVDDCWAFEITGLMEGGALRQGHQVELSPEYLDLYWIYTQIYNNFKTGNANFVPDEGFEGSAGLNTVKKFGAVPKKLFSYTPVTLDDDTNLMNRIQAFVNQTMSDPKQIAQYESVDENGINEKLLSDFSNVVGVHLPKPDEVFKFNGKAYTPKSFVSRYLKFKPDDFVLFTPQSSEIQSSMNLIRQALKSGTQVGIGFTLFQDAIPSDPSTNIFEMVSKTGIFSSDLCPNQHCATVRGGHVVLAVNWLEDANANVNAIIIKNSWGTQFGRDDRGSLTNDPTKKGFFIIENGYLFNGVPEFVIPKKFIPKLNNEDKTY